MKPAGMWSFARGLALMALLLAPGAALLPTQAADGGAFSSGTSRVVQLGIGKSYVVDLPANAAEVLVADPKIANAVVRSARKAYVIGIALGETDIIFFDAEGQQIESLAVSVARDLTPIRTNLHTSMPDSAVSASAVGESVMLTGSVRSAGEAQTAVDIAANLVGSADKVVNAIAIEGRDQVMLKVSVVEMQRNVAKQLGIKWDLTASVNGTQVGFGSNPPFGLNGGTPGTFLNEVTGVPLAGKIVDGEFIPGVSFDGGGNGLGVLHTWATGSLLANLEALETNNLLRTLAEPTLMAISGEKAEFLAGGEFPVPVPSDNGIGIEYKKYGVSLTFTPVVLSTGRISMQIGTEVSEPNAQGTVIAGTAVSGLSVRRALTTVELPSGGSLAMAGLLQDNSRQAFAGLPGLINLPVLGSLFRSRDYQRGQTELVIIVTPYLAKSNGRDKLALPDDGFSTPTDVESLLLGRLNKIYAPGGKPVQGAYRGPVGHIVE
jgi:pilus assembly protein CpaC